MAEPTEADRAAVAKAVSKSFLDGSAAWERACVDFILSFLADARAEQREKDAVKCDEAAELHQSFYADESDEMYRACQTEAIDALKECATAIREDEDKFSPTMRSCLHYAREHGGILRRYPGGFWAKKDWKGMSDAPWFGTSTVEALEARGAGRYTEERKRRHSDETFPVEFTLIAVSTETAAKRGQKG